MGATMETTIQDHGGALFEVKFEMGADSVPTLHSMRVLDELYRPVGPNIADLMGAMFVMPLPGIMEPFLSQVSEQIHDSRGIEPGCEAV